MSIVQDIRAALIAGLGDIVGDRVFPDRAPLGTDLPYITFSQIGGMPLNFLESAAPSKKNGRFQFNSWGPDRLTVEPIGQRVEDILVAAPTLRATVLTGVAATTDDPADIRGTQQDFSIWF